MNKPNFLNYKLRAENPLDILIFMNKFFEHIYECRIIRKNTFVTEFIFSSNKSLSKIYPFFDSITDSHIMKQTLSLEKEYTGERYF